MKKDFMKGDCPQKFYGGHTDWQPSNGGVICKAQRFNYAKELEKLASQSPGPIYFKEYE